MQPSGNWYYLKNFKTLWLWKVLWKSGAILAYIDGAQSSINWLLGGTQVLKIPGILLWMECFES